MYERILMKIVHFNFNDRSLWNEILPAILHNK